MIEIVLGGLAILALARGAWFGYRGRRGGSAWLAAASALTLALTSRLHGSPSVAITLVWVAGGGISAAGVLLVRERVLTKDRRDALADADDREVRDLIEEAHHIRETLGEGPDGSGEH